MTSSDISGTTARAKAPAVGTARRRTLVKPQTIRDTITGYLFVAPALFLIFIFGIFPIGYAIHMSLHTWRIQRGQYLCDAPLPGKEPATDALGQISQCLAHFQLDTLGSWNGVLVLVLGFSSLFVAYWFWVHAFTKRDEKQNLFVGWQIALLVLGLGLIITALNGDWNIPALMVVAGVIVLGGFWFWTNTGEHAELSPSLLRVMRVLVGIGAGIWALISAAIALAGVLLVVQAFSFHAIIAAFLALWLLGIVFLVATNDNDNLKASTLSARIDQFVRLSARLIGVIVLANITVALGMELSLIFVGADNSWATTTLVIYGALIAFGLLGLPFSLYVLGDDAPRLRGYVFPVLAVFFAIALIGVRLDGFTFYARDFIDVAFITLGESLGGVQFSALGFFYLGLLLMIAAYRFWVDAFTPGSRRAFARWMVALAMMAIGISVISYGWNEMTGTLSARNRDFLDGLEITVYYAFGSIPLQLLLGLLLAYVLFQNIRGKEWYRMVFFLPYVTPAVASAVVFQKIFTGSDASLMNSFLASVDSPVFRWVNEPRPFLNVVFGWDLTGFMAGPSMALISVIILGVWTYTGYNAVIFLAGLGGVPNDLYEAAKVDGASQWHLFRFITLPLLSPITFYLSLLGFIGTFQAFNTLFVMRTPSAQGTLDTAGLVIYDTFRMQNRYGEAAAQAIALFVIILILTQLQRNVFEKRVFYG